MTKFKNLWRNLVRMLDSPSDLRQPHIENKGMRISESARAAAGASVAEKRLPDPDYSIRKPQVAPGVVPATFAQDSSFAADYSAQINQAASYYGGGAGFPGYPYLAELNQLSEYRSPSETTAMEMTRKWIKLVSHGDGDKSNKLEQLEAKLKELNVRALFRRAAELNEMFGHGQIFIKIKGQESDEARKLPLVIDPATIKKGSLLGFSVIEPLWTTPYAYNSNDPTAPDFYKPRAWFVLGKQTHADRLLSFISRPVPDMLKPAYNFGGLSMTQLMDPYVRAWLRTRDSVNDLINAFSITGIKTDMSSTLQGGSGDSLFARMDLFNKMRDNRGLMLLDKNEEEMFQFQTSLSGLDKLQAQSQEHMAAPSHTPMVKLLGVTPSGLNASSEEELDVYDDYIAAMQENLFRAPLTTVINLIQLSEFGEIDDSIGFEFEPMKQLNGADLAAVRKSDADAAAVLIQSGVLDPLEERQRLASDPNSGYMSIDVNKVPEPMEDPDAKPDDGVSDDDAK